MDLTGRYSKMKRMIRHNALAAILLIAGLAFSACNSVDLEEKEAVQTTTYTLTVQPANDGALTKGLSKNAEGCLVPEWKVNDIVTVYENNTEVGELTAKEKATKSGSSIEFSGEISLDQAPQANEVLRLYYHTGDYSKQDGTLEGIGESCDYAYADVKITGVDGSNITTEEATFKSQQAIVEFKLLAQDTKGIKAKQMTITYGEGKDAEEIEVDLEKAADDLYVAIQLEQAKTFKVNVVDENGFCFHYNKAEKVSFQNGKYYRVQVTMVQDLTLGVTYYSDNSIGRNTHAAESNPVGIVVYLGDEDVAGKGKSGLVMSLTHLGTYPWGKITENTVNAQQVTKPAETFTDLDGMANTVAMKNAGSTAAAAVLALKKVNEKTTDWFIPSSGQWLAMLEDGLGNADARSTWVNGDGKKWSELRNVVLFKDNKDGKTVLEIFNYMLSLSGASYSRINIDENYWTSSECDRGKGIRTNLGVKNGYSTFKMAGDKDKTNSMNIRPFFAF